MAVVSNWLKKNVEVAEAAEVVQPPDLSLGADPGKIIRNWRIFIYFIFFTILNFDLYYFLGLVHPDQDLDPGADQHPEVQDKKQMEKKNKDTIV